MASLYLGRYEHGTRVAYQHGCGCDYCRRINAVYQKHHRAGRRGTHKHPLPAMRLDHLPTLFD